MSLFNPHEGSWNIGGWQLPDFGVTEAAAGWLGADYTPEGGSDIFPDSQAGTTDLDQQRLNDLLGVMGTDYSGDTSTYTAPTQQTGDTSGGFDMSMYPGWDETAARADYQATGGPSSGGGVDPYAQLRGEISSGWDSYIASLDKMMGGLTGQRTAQEGIAQSQMAQGENVLGTQLGEGQALLGTQRERTEANQSRTLRDLTSNIRNLFQTGNVMLGARGAGDSSAAGQYSHALTKLGSRQRSDITRQGADIMKEIDARESKLKNIYDSEIRNLGHERDQKIGQVAQWFGEAQMQLQQAQASGELGKSQDLQALSKTILTNAMSKLQEAQKYAKDRYSALEQWAMNSSKSIAQLKQNMQGIGQFAPNMPGFSPMQGTPQVDAQGNMRLPIGYGSQQDEDKPLFQNPSWLTGK